MVDIKEAISQLQNAGYDVVKHGQIRSFDKYLDREEFKYILWLDRIYQKIISVPGNIVEVGVARGRNAIIFGHLIKMQGEDSVRNYYGIDTFNGYTSEDLAGSPYLSDDEWKQTTCEFVVERIRKAGLSDVSHVYEGSAKEVAPEFVKKRNTKFSPNGLNIALLYIDCNAYECSKWTMDFFKEYMSPGGVVCIDEKLQGGETKALKEFCRENGFAFVRDSGPFGVPAYTCIK